MELCCRDAINISAATHSWSFKSVRWEMGWVDEGFDELKDNGGDEDEVKTRKYQIFLLEIEL